MAIHSLHCKKGSKITFTDEHVTSGQDVAWDIDKIDNGDELVAISNDKKFGFTISGPDSGSPPNHKKTPDFALLYTTITGASHKVGYDVYTQKGMTKTLVGTGFLVIDTIGNGTPDPDDKCGRDDHDHGHQH